MNIAKTTLVYFSPTGTTKTVLEAMAKGIGLPVNDLDLTLPSAREQQYTFGSDELVIIGFPVYGGRIPQIQDSIFPLLEKATTSQAGTDCTTLSSVKVVPVVVYGNRAYDDALLELTQLCREKNYMPLAAAAFIGEHSYNPNLAAHRPDKADKELAQNFGERLIHWLKNYPDQGRLFDPSVIPGNMPYKVRGPKLPIVPETDDNCVNCMLCAQECPMQAISSDDPADINQTLCILCAACVKKCPYGAKHIVFEPLQQLMKNMSAANSEPKQPTLFLPE